MIVVCMLYQRICITINQTKRKPARQNAACTINQTQQTQTNKTNKQEKRALMRATRWSRGASAAVSTISVVGRLGGRDLHGRQHRGDLCVE